MHTTKNKKGGEDCYLLQVCSDKANKAGEQGETAPDNGQRPWWLNVGEIPIRVPTNPKPRQTPGKPAEPAVAARAVETPTIVPAPETVPVVLQPEMVADTLSRVLSWSSGAASARPDAVPWAKPAPTTTRIPTPAGGVTLPRSAATYTTPQKALAVNKIGAKGNLALIAVDMATNLLEAYNDGRLQTVADAADILARYPNEVEQGLRYIAGEGAEAVMEGDLVKLGDVVAELNPSFSLQKTTDELMQAAGVAPPPDRPPLVTGGLGNGPSNGATFSGTLDNLGDLGNEIAQGAQEIAKTAIDILPWRW